MFFDTHCHFNFEAFDKTVDDVIERAKKVGVDHILIPGTDVPTSKKAVQIAEKHKGIYAAVGIHPHHVFEIYSKVKAQSQNFLAPVGIHSDLNQIEQLLSHPKVVAIGEVGIDRHIYQKTKYPDYKIGEEFVRLQKEVLKKQIDLVVKYDKSLILHNREAKADMFDVLNKTWNKKLEGRSVFHCCEPDHELLEFAKDHKMFIGVDGDITYYKEKQQFIKLVPLEMLVLETDSPYLSPFKKFPNEPKNIPLIAEFVAKLKGISVDEVAEITTENAQILFKI
ncbi:MAG: TatD family hydrolase [Candidatus Roizmanbacteria bacterium]|nr:TatD family hydrolase [Candidatus Roizmanbacteria bacterium]